MSNNGRKIEEEYKVVLESSPDCIKLMDVSGDLLYINPAGIEEHALGSLKEALKRGKKALKEDIIEEDADKFEDAFEKAKNGQASSVEIRHNEGSNRDVCIETMSPVMDEKRNVIAVFGISRDISYLKKAEKELMRSKEKLENVVEERTRELKEKIAELERINEVMTGRELRMIELKDEIRKLKEKYREE